MRSLFFFLFCLSFLPHAVFAQEHNKDLERFKSGGEAGFYRMIKTSIKMPRFCRDNNIQGKVYVAFNVLPDGKLDSVRTVGASRLILDEEAMLMVKLSEGHWEESEQTSRITIPISFGLAQYEPRKEAYDEKLIKKYEKFKASKQFPYTDPAYFANRKAAYDANAELVKARYNLPEPSTLDVPQLFEQGTALAQAKRYKEARPYFEELVKKDKKHQDGLFNLGVCYFQLGDKSRACATWKYLQSLGSKLADDIISANCP